MFWLFICELGIDSKGMDQSSEYRNSFGNRLTYHVLRDSISVFISQHYCIIHSARVYKQASWLTHCIADDILVSQFWILVFTETYHVFVFNLKQQWLRLQSKQMSYAPLLRVKYACLLVKLVYRNAAQVVI